MMAVNLGTRGIDAARNLVEYCNHPGGDATGATCARARVRGAARHQDSGAWATRWTARGRSGTRPPTNTDALAVETAKAMRWVDPSIELVACGSSNRDDADVPRNGKRPCSSIPTTHVDYISLHAYYGNREDDTANFLAKTLDMDSFIRSSSSPSTDAKAQEAQQKDDHLSFDEWNVWYHSNEADRKIEPWKIAPAAARGYLHVRRRPLGRLHADHPAEARRPGQDRMSRPARQRHRTDHDREGRRAWRQTIFYPVMHASTLGRGTSLLPVVKSPVYDARDFEAVPVSSARRWPMMRRIRSRSSW